jgi:lipoprotein-releasing system permease protein
MFELSIAWRFLREGKIQTLMIVVGISMGIAVQIFLSALISGLQKDLINKTVGTSPHITMTAQDRIPPDILGGSSVATVKTVSTPLERKPLRKWIPVSEQLDKMKLFNVVAPVLERPAFVFKGEKSEPVVIKGIEPVSADQIYDIKGRMVSGVYNLKNNGILIGTDLAKKLQVSDGQSIRLTSSDDISDVFVILGIFDLESKPLNESWVIMSLERAQKFFSFDGAVSSLEIQVKDVFKAEEYSQHVKGVFPEYLWVSWQENNANLLAALKSQSGSSNLIQFLVLLAVMLGISSVLAVSAVQKTRQIGILKAIGTKNRSISRIFLWMGFILGLGGAITGCFIGYGLIVAFLSATAGANGKPLFPLSISPSLYIITITIATVCGTIAASIPARRSSKLNAIEVIRNG